MGNRKSKRPLQPVKCASCCSMCAVFVGPALLEGGMNWEVYRALMEENFHFCLQGLGSLTSVKSNCSNCSTGILC